MQIANLGPDTHAQTPEQNPPEQNGAWSSNSPGYLPHKTCASGISTVSEFLLAATKSDLGGWLASTNFELTWAKPGIGGLRC